jgi:hypothetical protein
MLSLFMKISLDFRYSLSIVDSHLVGQYIFIFWPPHLSDFISTIMHLFLPFWEKQQPAGSLILQLIRQIHWSKENYLNFEVLF